MNRKLFDLIKFHLQHHRSLDVQDIYKCLYQGVFGAEHLLLNVNKARIFFFDEFDRIAAENKQPLVEPVSVDGQIIRVNFAPYKATGGPAEKLWEVFKDSARAFTPQHGLLEELWTQFYSLGQNGHLPFDPDKISEFGHMQKQKGYPPQHHTPDYRRNNHPAYRVVLKAKFDPKCP